QGGAQPMSPHLLALAACPRLLVLVRQDERNAEAYALRRQHLVPFPAELLIGLADPPDAPVEVEEAQLIDTIIFLSQGCIPVDLIRQGVPSKADDWHAGIAHAEHVGPLLPEPIHCLFSGRPLLKIGFGMHDRQLITVVVLTGDLAVPEYLACG